MNSFRDKITQFMQGRYGFDRLSRLLISLSLVFWGLCIAARFTPWRWLSTVFSIFNTLLYAVAIFRMLSRNIASRTLENERYLQFCSRTVPKIDRMKANMNDREHVYKNCPACGSLLRLKKVRGKHTTQCPKCGQKFKVYIMFGEKTAQRGGKG